MKRIVVRGAREHNLKDIDVDIPRDSLVVISGMSGSGKSSLAFDTLYAEGQRRYVESLSAYARQFLGRLNKPDVDYIGGLSPAISIEQKTTHRNPRSTVGTVTEIFDYLRLLYARIGTPHCPSCGREIREQSLDQIVEAVMSAPEGTRLTILAPVVRSRKGGHQRIFDDARKGGFVRVRVDGEMLLLDEPVSLDKRRKHDIEIVVDRIVLDASARTRLAESIETALSTADGRLVVRFDGAGESEERFFSQTSACPECGISIPELQPRLFSFNNPYGACEACSGLGMTLEFDPDLVVPDRSLSFNQGAVATNNPNAAWHRSWFEALARKIGFDLDTPFDELPKDVFDMILNGSDEPIEVRYENRNNTGRFEFSSTFRGVLNELKRRYLETQSEGIKEWLEQFMRRRECPACRGKRLKPESLAVTVGGKNVSDTTALTVEEAVEFFRNLSLSETERQIAAQILKEILSRLEFLSSVGLDYLTLERRASTLSGGEAQRIRLATQIGSQLVGVLYILDEPTIGLHQRDNEKLISTLTFLRDLGNTLIVVEHDEQTLMAADHLIDLGPGAGVEGGYVVARGTPREVMECSESLTGQYLSGARTMPRRTERRAGAGKSLILTGVSEHNLKHIDVSFPLGVLVAITGVSGSGKSTLLSDVLYPALANRISRTRLPEGAYESIGGVDEIDKVINIDQSPIGRTPRSNPATYVGLFTIVRDLFASLPESRARGYKPGRFSFNVSGGRCENCKGDGTIKIEMHFLPDVYIQCDVCRGKRFNQETLDIRYRGKNIHEVLEMSVEEAAEFFERIPSASRKLETLLSVGLGYVKLGQSALTLSGGEAQRVKLSLELSKRSTGRTLYLLDEPTTGLHFEDVRKLMEVLDLLVDRGNTVVLIEHNLDVIRNADYVIDLGPEGGGRGGEVVATGPPEAIAEHPRSYTGRFLKSTFRSRAAAASAVSRA